MTADGGAEYASPFPSIVQTQQFALSSFSAGNNTKQIAFAEKFAHSPSWMQCFLCFLSLSNLTPNIFVVFY